MQHVLISYMKICNVALLVHMDGPLVLTPDSCLLGNPVSETLPQHSISEDLQPLSTAYNTTEQPQVVLRYCKLI